MSQTRVQVKDSKRYPGSESALLVLVQIALLSKQLMYKMDFIYFGYCAIWRLPETKR